MACPTSGSEKLERVVKEAIDDIEEGKNILSKISDDEFVITLEILGKMIDSVELAHLIHEKFTYGFSKITFVIGGSNGLSSDVIKRSN